MALNDAKLVQRTLAGNREAFEDLVERHRRTVFALALQRGLQSAEAEDVAQEVFIRAFRNLNKLHKPAQFARWILGIAAHITADWTRRKVRRRIEEEGSERDLWQVLPPRERVSVGVDEDTARVLLALEQLPEEQRIVVTLRYMHGMSPKEIAAQLGEPRGTVRSRLHHALLALQGAFGVTPEKRVPQAEPLGALDGAPGHSAP